MARVWNNLPQHVTSVLSLPQPREDTSPLSLTVPTVLLCLRSDTVIVEHINRSCYCYCNVNIKLRTLLNCFVIYISWI